LAPNHGTLHDDVQLIFTLIKSKQQSSKKLTEGHNYLVVLSFIMLSACMLNLTILIVVMLSVIMLNLTILTVVMLNVIMLSANVLHSITLIVVMLIVILFGVIMVCVCVCVMSPS
jgi:hypothetical protein